MIGGILQMATEVHAQRARQLQLDYNIYVNTCERVKIPAVTVQEFKSAQVEFRTCKECGK